jgi:hypothetical protein
MYNHALTMDEVAAICPPPRTARNPTPADGTVGVTMPLFKWEAGYKGIMHEVYLGTSPELGPADLVGPRSPGTMFYYFTGTLKPGVTYYWRVDEIEADMKTVNTGIVWSFTVQALTAYMASPADGATAVSVAPTLTWQPGQGATKHHVYFGANLDAVTQGAASVDKGMKDEASFAPGTLDTVTTYYWRVDETVVGGVNAGPVWKFTTCLPVDDFESYTDKANEEIWSTWIDGYGTNWSSGSTVGYGSAPFAETTIVHGGKQSMPLEYNNVNTPFYSEAKRDFAPADDWTASGVDTLVLFVYGKTGNSAAPLYVALTDSANHTALVTHPKTTPLSTTKWTEWAIPLSDFTGVNAAKIKTMCIGLGQRTGGTSDGKGIIFIDDIWLTKSK